MTTLLFLSGCGGHDLTTHTVAQVAQVKEMTTCEAMPAESCVGQFGFTIDNMGNFTAGPSPTTGKVVQGTITPAELMSLQSAMGPVVQSSSMSCQGGMSIPGVSDTIDAAFTDGTMANLYSSMPQLCFRGGSMSGGAFRDQFHQLLTKYYPNPFPA